MEFYTDLQHTDDATDLFLLAKERLLDVNDWKSLTDGNLYDIALTDAKGRKQNRNAHVGDMIKITGAHAIWIEISGIQYDYFPDIDSESISMLLRSVGSFSQLETILIKRDRNMLMVHCNGGNELPTYRSSSPTDRINTLYDMHPVLQLHGQYLQQFLEGMIKVYANNAA